MDCVNSVTDIENKLIALESPLLKGLKFITSDYGITIDKILINDKGFPIVIHALVAADNMTFKAWNDGKTVPKTRFKQISTDKLFSFNEILQIIEVLENLNVQEPIPDPLEEAKCFVTLLKTLDYPNDGLFQKVMFAIEQLELAFMHNKHRRYSSGLLSSCVLWENTSPNLYKQIRDENVLTLPS